MSALVISAPQQATIPIPPPLPGVASKATRAPLPWVGGKFYLAKWLIEHMPQHRVYIEPFAGMVNVLLKKTPAEVEIINDLDERVVNFFRVLRDPNLFGELKRRCCLTPYSRQQFAASLEADELQGCPVEKAWRFFTRCRQARGGLGMSAVSANAWAVSTRTRRQMAEPVSKYLSAIDGLEAVVERLREVVIECLPATDLLRKYDAHDTFFYCDPPYLHETRPNKVGYGVEMTDDQHREFLNQARGCEGKVMISGYPSDLYDSLMSDWRRVEKHTHVQCSNSGNDRTEVIWMNYEVTSQTSRKLVNDFESLIQ